MPQVDEKLESNSSSFLIKTKRKDWLFEVLYNQNASMALEITAKVERPLF